jgi:hypothetical protein
MTLRCTLLAGAAVLLAGCASATSGSGTVPSSASLPPTSSGTSTSTAPSATPPLSGFPSGSTSSGPTSDCVPGADYCDGFSSASSGWPVDNESHFYANYSKYRGGTYRMGERTARAKTQLAPFDTTTVSRNYGVQIDVDAVLGKSAPTSAYIGIVCWDHATSADAEAGFLFFVTTDSVDVTLLADSGGEPHTLDDNGGTNFLRPFPATNHLTATCRQQRSSGGTQAEFALSVNGSVVLQKVYAKSVKNYAWTPGSKAGLLVAGKGSDVYYDNFAVTGQ